MVLHVEEDCVVLKISIVAGCSATRPAVVDNRIYIGSNDGRLYVLDASNGKKLSEFEAGSALSASPAIAGGRLVIGSQDGKIFCLQ